MDIYSTAHDWRRRLLTSRFFVIALIAHALFVMFFGGRVLFQKYVEKQDFAADQGFFLKGTADEDKPPAPPAPPTPQIAPVNPTVPVMSTITTTNPSMTDFTLPAAPIMAPNMSNTIAEKLTTAPATAVQSTQSLGALPTTMSARGSSQRAAAMSKAGGKQASEQAVINALRYLQKVQNANGTWGKQYPGAMTGLATLCFLGHGETPQASKEFGIVVSNAINAIIDGSTKNNGVLTLHGNRIDQGGSYEHPIVTYAASEAYTMTKDERLAPVVTKAVDYILKGQSPDGGWVYGYAKTVPSDTSVTGWQVQALKAAKLTGLPIDGIPAAMDNAIKDLDRVYDAKTGQYGYRTAGDHKYSLTGVGVLCKVFWLGKVDNKIRDSVKGILDGPPVNYVDPAANLYAWYYHTQACFMVGGSAWERWNRMFQDTIVGNQMPDGSWPVNNGKEAGSLNTADTIDGSLYRTCLCTLMLEVYYRYLPTGKEQH